MLEKKQSSAVNIQYGRFNQISGALICINQSFVSVHDLCRVPTLPFYANLTRFDLKS